MEVSWNRGTPKSLKIDHFWDPPLWKPPYKPVQILMFSVKNHPKSSKKPRPASEHLAMMRFEAAGRAQEINKTFIVPPQKCYAYPTKIYDNRIKWGLLELYFTYFLTTRIYDIKPQYSRILDRDTHKWAFFRIKQGWNMHQTWWHRHNPA